MWLDALEYEGHEKNLALGVWVLGSDPLLMPSSCITLHKILPFSEPLALICNWGVDTPRCHETVQCD